MILKYPFIGTENALILLFYNSNTKMDEIKTLTHQQKLLY